MLNEIYFYGKDSDGDAAANVRTQGREWARAISQVYLHYQKDTHYWTASHPCGDIDLSGAVLLPKPVHTLLETLKPVSGEVEVNKNAAGKQIVIFDKPYDHGLGCKPRQRSDLRDSLRGQRLQSRRGLGRLPGRRKRESPVRREARRQGNLAKPADREAKSQMAHLSRFPATAASRSRSRVPMASPPSGPAPSSP